MTEDEDEGGSSERHEMGENVDMKLKKDSK